MVHAGSLSLKGGPDRHRTGCICQRQREGLKDQWREILRHVVRAGTGLLSVLTASIYLHHEFY